MTDSGGSEPKVKVYFYPKKRTKHEQRELTKLKLKQLEAIGYEIMGKKNWGSGL